MYGEVKIKFYVFLTSTKNDVRGHSPCRESNLGLPNQTHTRANGAVATVLRQVEFERWCDYPSSTAAVVTHVFAVQS
jgi:hypothetical protein